MESTKYIKVGDIVFPASAFKNYGPVLVVRLSNFEYYFFGYSLTLASVREYDVACFKSPNQLPE